MGRESRPTLARVENARFPGKTGSINVPVVNRPSESDTPRNAGGILLELSKVNKDYAADQNAEPIRVLRDLDLRIGRGDAVAIVGPSGSGKSTLLHLLGALDRPTSGQVLWDGQDLGTLGEAALAAFRSREIGFVFQAHYLLPQCTVLENVLVPTLACPDPARRVNVETRAQRLLERVGLGGRLTHRPGQLSGGERQRAAVVRALINQPQLLLADEPTGSLDGAAALALGQLLIELNREQGVTLVVVTHALELAARMQRVLELRDGQLKPTSL